MAKARFLTPNLCVVAGVTITGSSEQVDYPAAFLANTARWKPWRSSSGTGNQTLDFDFGSAKTLTAVALVNWRAHTGGTVKAQYWTGAAWADLGTFTLTSPNPTGVIALWFASQSTSKLRILFTNTGAVNEFVQLGVVVAGAYLQPTVNFRDDVAFVRTDPSLHAVSPDGQQLSYKRTKYFDVAAIFEGVPTADKDDLLEIFEANGATEPFVLAADADDPNQVAYGYFQSALQAQHIAGSINRWRVGVQFQEAR